MIQNKYYWVLIVCALLSTSLIGCATIKESLGLTNNIDISIRATSDVNPDTQGTPSPVVVRFYELSAAEDFRRADFATLHDNEQAAIGKIVVTRDEFELKPEQNRNIARRVKRGTKYIGVLAAYHNVANIKWRAIISLNPDGTTELALNLEKTGITVSED